MTNGKTTTIYGASDDLIELGGQLYEEFNVYDEARYLAFSTGTLLSIEYSRDGVWRIHRLAGDAKVTSCEDREGYDGPDGKVYSDVATVEGATWVVCADAIARAKGAGK